MDFASQAEFNTENFATNAFVECVDVFHFFTHNDFVFRFLQFAPDSGVGHWFGFETEQFTASCWWADGKSDIHGC